MPDINPQSNTHTQQTKGNTTMTTATAYAHTFNIDDVPAEDQERVAAMIPNPLLADGYVHRDITGMDDFDLLDYAMEERENVILSGPTGSSKTTLFRSYAAARGLPFALVECHGAMDPGMIVGKTTTLGDGTLGWMDGNMTLAIRYGGVTLLDEVNMAIPRVMAAWKALISVTRSMTNPENAETIKAAESVLLGAAYNPRYQGTSRLNEALLNQFALPLDWDYDRAVEEQLVESPRLLDVAYNIRSLAEIRTPVSTNSLQEFQRHARRLGYPRAHTFFVNRFAPEERAPVSRAIEAEGANIAAELGVQFDSDLIVSVA